MRRRPAHTSDGDHADNQDGEPDGPGHTIRLPFPPFVGDRHTNARFTEGAAARRLLLEGESIGVCSGLVDARPEWHNTTKALTRAPRGLLTGADVAGVHRARAILRRWASNQSPNRPLAEAVRNQLRSWLKVELGAADTERRRPRYILKELTSPPLALGWLASHQEDKFPGAPPAPTGPFLQSAPPKTPSSLVSWARRCV